VATRRSVCRGPKRIAANSADRARLNPSGISGTQPTLEEGEVLPCGDKPMARRNLLWSRPVTATGSVCRVTGVSHLLLGAIMQAGMVVARAEDPAVAKRAMSETFARIVSAL